MPRVAHPSTATWGLALALTLAASAFGQNASTTTLTNEVQGYRLEYPTDWQVQVRGADGSAAELSFGDTAAMAVFVDPVSPDQAATITGMTIEDWLDLLREQASDSLDDTIVLEAGERSIAGLPAAVLRFSGVDQPVEAAILATFALLPTEDALYFLAFRADLERAPELEPVFELVLSSFTLLGPEARRVWYHDGASGVRLAYPPTWRLDERPGLERSLLKGTYESVERDGTTADVVSYPEVDSFAIYHGDAAVFVHAYLRRDVPAAQVSEVAALMRDELERELEGFDADPVYEAAVGGRHAVALDYTGVDRYLGAAVRGTAYVFEGTESWYSLVLEAPLDEYSTHRDDLEAILQSVEFARPGHARRTFGGQYGTGSLTLELEGAGETYVGTMTLDGRVFTVTASAVGAGLEGTFMIEDGTSFSFTAELSDGGLTLESGGARHELARR